MALDRNLGPLLPYGAKSGHKSLVEGILCARVGHRHVGEGQDQWSLSISLPYIDNRTLDGKNDTYINNNKLQKDIIDIIENEMKTMKQKKD